MMTNSEYQASEGISKSMLDKIHISPLAFYDRYLSPDREPDPEQSFFLFGTAAHGLILEPEVFKETYFIGFDKTKYPSALDTMEDLKAELASLGLKTSGTKPDLIERLVEYNPDYSGRILSTLSTAHSVLNQGLIELPAKDYKDLLDMLESINKHHTAGKLLNGAKVEQSMFVKDEYGLIRKCRTDLISANGRVMADLKTTTDVSARGFGGSIAKFRYHVQAAWYLDTAKLVMGDDAPSTFCFIPVQKNRPYDCAVHYLTEDQIEAGRREYMKDYDKLRECLETNIWHGADGGSIVQAMLPSWAYSEVEI